MGLIEKREYSEGCLLGSWEITEKLEDLLSRLILEPEESEKVSRFRSHDRKLEYLSVRVLLNNMLGRRTLIVYDKTNKPFIKGNLWQISISHSGKLTSILLSKTKKVGIDLENMSHRISKISHKFINPGELITDDPDLRRYHLYIHWCAKEALYKICDKGGLNFKEHLIIEPFEVNESGDLRGTVIRDGQQKMFDLRYFRSGNYVTVMCCKPIDDDITIADQ